MCVCVFCWQLSFFTSDCEKLQRRSNWDFIQKHIFSFNFHQFRVSGRVNSFARNEGKHTHTHIYRFYVRPLFPHATLLPHISHPRREMLFLAGDERKITPRIFVDRNRPGKTDQLAYTLNISIPFSFTLFLLLFTRVF